MTDYYVNPAAGGGNDGTSWTDAWTDFQSAADNATAGDTVWCQGTQTLSAIIDLDTNSGDLTNGHIKYIGVKSGTTNEPPVAADRDGSYFILDGDSAVANCLKSNGKHYLWFENFELKNATDDNYANVTASQDYCVFINIISHDAADAGFNAFYQAYCSWIRCRAYDNSGEGWQTPYRNTYMFFCESINNAKDGIAADGLATGGALVVIGSVMHTNSDHGLVTDEGLVALHCVIDEQDDDGVYANGKEVILIGNRITNNGLDTSGYGINRNAGFVLYGWNFLDGNDSGATNGSFVEAVPYDSDTDTNETSGTEGYNDGDNDDFNLTTSATLRNTTIELS